MSDLPQPSEPTERQISPRQIVTAIVIALLVVAFVFIYVQLTTPLMDHLSPNIVTSL